MRNAFAISLVALAAGGFVLAGCGKDSTPAPATRPAPPPDAPRTLPSAETEALDVEHLARVQADINEGLTFLLGARCPDGGWGFSPKESHPGLTAMALKALLQHEDYDIDSPVVKRGFAVLMKFRQDDGGFYVPGQGNVNYITCLAAMALATAGDPRQKDALAGAVTFLRGQQIVAGSRTPAGRVIEANDPMEGGVSYGKHGRPDLSNLGFWMEAMHEAGVPGDDEAMQRALAFVKRLQSVEEGTRGQSFVVRGENDGGFIYAIRHEGGKFVGESKAGETRRGLRSYGSMTYTGFKSMLYANVARDDPRVQAAYEWIRRYWRLDSNPNMPQASSRQGLYYYYHVFAKALRAWGQDVIPDAQQVKHNWRHELIDVLHAAQRADGSWVNLADPIRWNEEVPTLATCYAVLALQETLKK